ncbi:ras-responsive element-binding protein 1-like isoform X2 [Neocloeon triangulifer]|nr:ras-responsive element-binding protein 1-like isoform X2 [Neocloeon triangulifer]
MAEGNKSNGGQDDIYSFKTDSPSGPESSDRDSKSGWSRQKYKRKMRRQSSDDEDEVPSLKPCIVVLQRSSLCEAAWQRERKSIEERQKIEPQQQNGNSSGSVSPISDCEFKCGLCSERFSGRNLYMHHMRAKHANNNNTPRQPSPPPPAKGDHLRFIRSKGVWKLDTRSLECDDCNKMLASPYKFKEHAEVEHGKIIVLGGTDDVINSTNFPCSQCHKVCKTKLSLDKHIFVKHSAQRGQLPSQPISAKTEEDLSKAGEAKTKAYECPYCFTLHANKDRFKKHLGFVPITYSDCHVVTDNNSLMRQKDPINCEVCGSKAANLAFLHAHQTTHTELPRPNECQESECHKKFIFLCQLNRHLLLHQVKNNVDLPQSPGQKVKGKFKCNLCAKRTRTKAKSDFHMQTCHKPNSQELRCEVCNICYASARQLTNHYAKKHEGMEPPLPLPDQPKEDDCWALPDATFAPFPTSSVRPESIGSSDSVSASDAFSMYFQSLQSLNPMDMDIPLDLEGNVSINEKILNPLDSSGGEMSQSHQPSPHQVSPEFPGRKKENELQFHTLQTVQHPEASITFLQNLPTAPLIATEPLPKLESSNQTNLLVTTLSNGYLSNFQVEEKPVALVQPEQNIITFTPTIQTLPVAITTPIQAQVLPIFQTTELKYDPKLDLAIKQELEKNTKELQEICESTAIGFIPIAETELVTAPVTNIVQPLAPEIVKIEPTSENIDKIVQEIMCPSSTANATPALPSKPPAPAAVSSQSCDSSTATPSEIVKKKLAAKTKRKKELEAAPVKSEPIDSQPPPVSTDKQEDCKLCGKFFNTHEMLIKHCQQNCPGRNQPGSDTTCQLCGEKLADRKLYLKHKKEMHEDSLLRCPACDKTFFLQQSLGRHMKQTCTHRLDYTCRKCKSKHESLESLRTHTQTVHPENVVCHICKKVLATSQSLKRHIKSHGKEAESQMVEKFSELDDDPDSSDSNLQKVSLNQQENLDITDDLSLNDLSSWGNNGEFNIENNLDDELMLLSNESLTCEFCGSTFASDKLLLRHLSSQHFPNTQWQPQARNSPVVEELASAMVSCNDS